MAEKDIDIHTDDKKQHGQKENHSPAADKGTTEDKHPKKSTKKKISLTEDEFRELTEKGKEAEENYDRFLRAKAELDNFRKRKEKERI
ncbi:MAG: hypothetical protein KAI64_06240, partial [Thermoplasmata archaeon]|nr:hypothetical protein [Thermoplasmata archaeon]